VRCFPSTIRKWELKGQLRVLKPLSGLILGPLKGQALNLKAVRKKGFTISPTTKFLTSKIETY